RILFPVLLSGAARRIAMPASMSKYSGLDAEASAEVVSRLELGDEQLAHGLEAGAGGLSLTVLLPKNQLSSTPARPTGATPRVTVMAGARGGTSFLACAPSFLYRPLSRSRKVVWAA